MPVLARGDLDSVAAYYAETAPQYRSVWGDQYHYGYWDERVQTHRESLERMVEVVADAAGIGPGDLVLDAGCGVGGPACWIAEHRRAHVVGVTVSPEQTRLARLRARSRGLESGVSFQTADYRRTGEPANYFDAVFFLESLCYAPLKADAIREAARVLKPGGRLVVADGMRSARPMDTRREQLLKTWLRSWAVPDLDTAEELVEAMEEAGLEVLEVRDITPHILPSARRMLRLGILTAPAVGLWLVSGMSYWQRQNYLGVFRQWRALRAGAWRYGLIVAQKPRRPRS